MSDTNSKHKLYILIQIINYIMLTLVLINDLIAIFIFGILHAVVFYFISKKLEKDKMVKLAGLFLVLMILMLIVSSDYNIRYGAPYFKGGSDDFAFEKTSFEIVTNNKNYISMIEDIFISNRNIHPDHNSKLYIFCISTLVSIFGDNYSFYMPRIMNIYLLIVNNIIIYLILQNVLSINKEKSFNRSVLISMLPINMILAVNTFRDTLVLTLILLFYYTVNVEDKSNAVKKYFLLGILAFLVFWIRKPFLVILLVIMILRQRGRVFKNPVFILIVLLGFVYFYQSFDYLLARYISNYSNSLNVLSTDGLSNFIFNRSIFPFGLFLRFLYGLISPLPSSGNILEMVLGFNTFLITNAYISLLLNIKKVKKNLKFLAFWAVQYLIIILTTFGFRHFLFNSILVGIMYSTLDISKKTQVTSLILNFGIWILLSMIYMLIKI